MLLPFVFISLADVLAMIYGRCYATRADVIAHFGSICYMAGVIAICGRHCYHLFRIYCIWLMLLPYVYGRCYANRADVIAHLDRPK